MIQNFNLHLQIANLSDNIIKHNPKLIKAIQYFHEVGLNVMTFEYEVLFIDTSNIKLTSHVRGLTLLIPDPHIHILILHSYLFHIFLHGLVGHVDLVLLVRYPL